MKTPKKHSLKAVTDKQLREALADLRVEVAAPGDFRAKLMQRLQQEGLVKDLPAPQRVSLWQRLARTLTPQRLAFGFSVALVVLVLVAVVPKREAQKQTVDSATSLDLDLRGQAPLIEAVKPGALRQAQGGASVQAFPPTVKISPASNEAQEQTLAQVPKVKPETMPDALMDKTGAVQEPSSVGAAEAASTQSSSSVGAAPASPSDGSAPSTGAGVPLPGGSVSSASVAPKPTIVVVEHQPTPVVNPLQGNSQLRGNEIRASKGEACVFLYKVLKTGHVRVEIFDRLGHSITVLRDADQGAGQYELQWGGQNDQGGLAATGIYVLRLTTPDYNAQHKLLLVK